MHIQFGAKAQPYRFHYSVCVCVCVCVRVVAWLHSYIQLLATLWAVACQAPLSVGFFL